MGEMHALTAADIALGEALRWDVYDAQGTLLLRKGFVVASARQLETLLARGLFATAAEYAEALGATPQEAAAADAPPSALRLMRQALERLQAVLASLAGDAPRPAGMADEIHAIADLVEAAIDIDADVTLASMLFKQEARNYAIRHCLDAATICILLARSTEWPAHEARTAACAALTMNLGMLQLQEQLQLRASGPTAEEAEQIRRHPQQSVDLLQQAGVDDAQWLDAILHHHENVDGSGYPAGLRGEAIPEIARLITLADRYTAMLAPRAYRKAVLPNEALRHLLLERGKGVDPTLAAHFIRTMGVYPPGTFVKLRSGETAVVSYRGKNGAKPIAHALIGPFGAPLPYPHRRDTGHERYEIREALAVEEGNIAFNMQHIWGAEGAA